MARCGPSMSRDPLDDLGRPIVWRLRLIAAPERVFSAWLTPADHVKFWCERSEQDPEGFRLEFIDGTVAVCRVSDKARPTHIRLHYFDAQVDITLQPLAEGTDLTLTARNVPAHE